MLSEDQTHWGAVCLEDGRTSFKVWAPKRTRVEVVAERRGGIETFVLEHRGDGVFEGAHPLPAGTRYRLKLDGGEAYPDPWSRFQPEGPHGPSEIIDPRAFAWSDVDWPGSGAARGHVIYELHVGTFTPEGTFAAATEKLPYLKRLGVTLVELMPVNGFPGRFNWGYDGVNLWAPNVTYGRPDDLRRFIDAAHRAGLGVVIDVVYNHFGPDGNFLPQFSDTWFNDQHPADWGAAVNFDGPGSEGVRRFVSENAAMWVREYHADGLRLDATQNLFDASERHIVGDITIAARAAAGSRQVWLVGESEKQEERLIRPLERNGSNLDAIWVDDFHHAARVAGTGQSEGYLQDYEGSPRELVALALRNSLYAGQYFEWQNTQRGTSLRQVDRHRVVFALQNHDQVANTLRGPRLHALAGESLTRALTTFFLLLPQTPMLFMGQELFADSPFLFFTDHHPELQRDVARGRAEFLKQFASAEHALLEGEVVDIGEDAFHRSKLDWSLVEKRTALFELHRELIALRKAKRLFHAPGRDEFDAAVLGPDSLVCRWTDGEEGDWLLMLSLGIDRDLVPCSEPLLAPPEGSTWVRRLSSEEARFGGRGALGKKGPRSESRFTFLTGEGPWRLQGHCATLLEAVRE